MIDLYAYQTSNAKRVSIMLEETGLEYRFHEVNLRTGEQKKKRFLKLNPSGRIPVIVDNDVAITLSQSSAILMYLAEKSGQFLSTNICHRTKTIEWLFFHATDVVTSAGNAFYLTNSEWLAYGDAAKQLNNRVFEWYQYFDQQLADNHYLAGDEYSIADIAMLPSVVANDDDFFGQYQHIKRWKDDVLLRPAVQRGLDISENLVK